MLPSTRTWHIADVVLAGAGLKEKRSTLNVIRLAFALVGLAGNVLIERNQLTKEEIEIGGVKWTRYRD
jgi:hypothetical protein